MKLFSKYLTTLIVISICSCDSQIDYSDIEGRWKIDTVLKLEDGTVAPDMGAYFTFKNDSTVVSENEVLGTHEANWTISQNNIKMIQNQDTTVMKIEKLTSTEMILISDLGEGNLKFKLLKEEQ